MCGIAGVDGPHRRAEGDATANHSRRKPVPRAEESACARGRLHARPGREGRLHRCLADEASAPGSLTREVLLQRAFVRAGKTVNGPIRTPTVRAFVGPTGRDPARRNRSPRRRLSGACAGFGSPSGRLRGWPDDVATASIHFTRESVAGSNEPAPGDPSRHDACAEPTFLPLRFGVARYTVAGWGVDSG
jgi:hypothetical protein